MAIYQSTFLRDDPIKSTEAGSAKYGPCEVCETYCAEVYRVDGTILYKGVRMRHVVFGCKSCLDALPEVK